MIMAMNKAHTVKKGTVGRLIKTLFTFFPVLLPFVLFLVVFNAIVQAAPAIFQQNIIALIEKALKGQKTCGQAAP